LTPPSIPPFVSSAASPPIFLETSVLLPIFDADHPHHPPSIQLFESIPTAGLPEAFCSLHSLAEFFAATTRIPPPARMPPEESLFHIKQLLKHVRTVTLDKPDYLAAITAVAELSLTGPLVYDALTLQCARKINATAIFTWNVPHFQRLAPDLADRIRTP
jgi:predicted nucleic acid-binding protein